MTIWIDGDGCPKGAVRSTLDEGKRRNIKVVLVTNIHHETQSEHRLIVDGSAQAVDMAIANRMQKGDVVITQDIGLSALVLSRQGYALSPTGQEYRSDDMALILEMREAAAKHRRGGGRTKGPKKRTMLDEERFQSALTELLDRIMTTTDHG
ncbi:hypothetical protein CIG75_13960 [Tumebacillus algifaecis]|uniref:UPF0178 protein CIG75_13960 n=1 Tax=Tumebacillus algifaecis TaxID=1214604 RepID=A0A223D3F2_9BACL|nr:DUF188 domain-containing protein [Tumebacillus algifaecis]ASS75953.1 hypothetical protein CIG75_13960 [Tumebacillus algifaecis]